MMQHEQPAIVFEHEDVGRVCLCAMHAVAGSGRDVFQARDPGRRALNFDEDFRNVDPHECRVMEDLFPAGADVLPSGEPVPVWMNANGARIRGPDFIHQVEIEAFEGEVELEVCLNNVFRIRHTV